MQYWEYNNRSGWVVRTRGISSRECPRCRSALYRVRSRLVDRLFGFLSGLQRFRYECESRSCGWEGNLPGERALS